MKLEEIAKLYDENHLGIREADQKVFDNPNEFISWMFGEFSRYASKPESLIYKIPDSLNSGIVEGFSYFFENHKIKNQFRIFSIGYFIANILKYIHGKEIDFKNMEPDNFYVLPPMHERLPWDLRKNGIVQGFVDAEITRQIINQRYTVEISQMMVIGPMWDGTTTYFDHKLIQIIDMILVLSSKSREKNKEVDTNA